MSKKNYSKMYQTEEEQTTEAEVAVTETETIDETPVVEKKPNKAKGVVVGCTKLNVREQMNTNATILCTLPASSEVRVIVDENRDEWYHVFTETGIEGYCMKKYIQL